ncbi:Hsp33 family molecular chaperone HslO [Methylococcus capsulatus]|uniref:Hsp33 family molecular chaperone HslO n=1 Tax=Methylococcus capsulatus TaxID=414 RepID=UPI001C533C0F|nr:Hsp33 family molecular chaperone HslO [Methylococcus capsulatus]QXP92055.1 Hsp33 family molecular chaperone HslO [Methylococcus capsulatus]
MKNSDTFQRFLFEDMGIRGELVRLDASWQAVLQRHTYPLNVSRQLGQALAAVTLLSGTIKFKGALIIQTQSRGPLHTLVVQATHRQTIRGLAHWRDPVPEGNLSEVFGEGRLVLTIQKEGEESYQGVVSLEGQCLAGALEGYFAHSEQLATRLWLFADGQRAAGLFLQALPTQTPTEEDWMRLVTLADTVTEHEMLHLPFEDLLYRLYHEEKVRLFEAEPVVFRCSCSRQRIEDMLLALGKADVEDILAEKGCLEVDCDFCNKRYQFDLVDIGVLFSEEIKSPPSSTKH